ncbi:DUF3379 family protein [Vibrio crassostreae]|uniref:DUF3379 family protein n=1 Tax=Vibrio crassostreae TaxID=246167 RepID=UPI002E19FE9A|nr:DUF3379 family protein [Vibrio crassostreae]
MNDLKKYLIRRKAAKVMSIAFVTGLLVGQINWNNTFLSNANASLADIAMKRVIRDQEFVKNIKENVSIQNINVKTRPFNYQFSKDIPYDVRYLNHCGFGGEDALYLIFEGKHGDISLFLTNATSEAASSGNKVNKNTFTMPLGDSDSSIILVGDLNENLESVADQITNIVKPIQYHQPHS